MTRTTLSQSDENLIINRAYCNLALSAIAHAAAEVKAGWDPYGRVAFWMKYDGLFLLQLAGFDLPEEDWHLRVDQISEMGQKRLKKYELQQKKKYESQQYRRKKKRLAQET